MFSRHKNLAALVLLLSIVCRSEGFKFPWDKNKDSQSEGKKTEALSSELQDEENAGKLDAEAIYLAEHLNELHESPSIHRHGVINHKDLERIMAAIEEVDKIAKSIGKTKRISEREESYNDIFPENDAWNSAPESGLDLVRGADLDEVLGKRTPLAPTQESDEPEKPDTTMLRAMVDPSDKRGLTPKLNFKLTQVDAEQKKKLAEESGKYFGGKFLKGKVKGAWKGTRNALKPIGKAITQLPTIMSNATDSISLMLKLDNRGRLLALIQEVDEDIRFVLREFSSFSMDWSPRMTAALNYVGDSNLFSMRYNDRDELDFSKEALLSLAFGYEFMKLMIEWRENLLIAHQAYKLYLDSLKNDLANDKDHANFQVDEEFIFNLQTVHNFFKLVAWESITANIKESRTKLDHLMLIIDDKDKDYERTYFRHLILFQELYEPTMEQFDQQNEAVKLAIVSTGANSDDFTELEKFYSDFRRKLRAGEISNIEWDIPEMLSEFMKRIGPEVQYNPIVYTKAFLITIVNDKKNTRSKARLG